MSQTLSYLGQLNAKELQTEHGQRGAILKASEQMEAHFLQSVLKQMRSATDAIAADNADSPLSGSNDTVFRDFYDAELAQTLAAGSNSNLAQTMAQQLTPAALKKSGEVVALDAYRQASALQPSLIQLQQGSAND
ncbi:rod-binding protein [uncultured Ferrimonas sp.]|uniref:rod-binding protein n=1 Tax=uncultured Ferrimonas sp. TaxID=432640 RepID=UPI00262B8776|nr:rod-binding protein [uncultured Ferrimonas sp.]